MVRWWRVSDGHLQTTGARPAASGSQYRLLAAVAVLAVILAGGAGAGSHQARASADTARQTATLERKPASPQAPVRVLVTARAEHPELAQLAKGKAIGLQRAAEERAQRDRAIAFTVAALQAERQARITSTGSLSGSPVGSLSGSPLPGTYGMNFALPVSGVLTSTFGARWGTVHQGIDIAGPIGTAVYAVAAGFIIDAGPQDGFGLWIRILHEDGTISVYGHVNECLVSAGDIVEAGQQIGTVGNRGDSTGPHLHLEIISGGQKVDPLPWLFQRGIRVGRTGY